MDADGSGRKVQMVQEKMNKDEALILLNRDKGDSGDLFTPQIFRVLITQLFLPLKIIPSIPFIPV